jgi:hypothetical protein
MVLMLSTTQLVVWTCFASLLVILAYVSVASARIRKQARFLTADQVAVSLLQTYSTVFVPVFCLLLLLSFLWMFAAPERVPIAVEKTIERQPFSPSDIQFNQKPIRWPTNIHVSQLSHRQIECLALNMYHEARSETNKQVFIYGRTLNQPELVAEVTLRRAHSTGKSICDTVYQDQQFSWTLGSVDVSEHLVYQGLYRAAKARIKAYGKGVTPLPIDHFYSHRKLTVPPDWASGMKVVAIVGSHTYLYSSSTI